MMCLRVIILTLISTSSARHPRDSCAAGYPDGYFEKLRDDEERTAAYRAAIERLAPGRVCLEIGTGGLALLAIIAAEAGAAHVYAIEANEAVAASAERAVAEAGLSDKISIIVGYSSDVTLPEGAAPDLLIHEILGEFAGAEGVVMAVNDARERHVRPSALVRSIPARALSLLAPMELPAAVAAKSGLAASDGAKWGGDEREQLHQPKLDSVADAELCASDAPQPAKRCHAPAVRQWAEAVAHAR